MSSSCGAMCVAASQSMCARRASASASSRLSTNSGFCGGAGLFGFTLLRRAHMHRRKRSAGKDRRKSIPNMTLIDDRPIEVLERLVPGHWEGDLIKGKQNRSQVGTLVERTTLYVALVRLENGKAETAAEGFAEVLNRFDAAMRRSMTYDQGREMARHQELSERTGLKVYLAHPHSPSVSG